MRSRSFSLVDSNGKYRRSRRDVGLWLATLTAALFTFLNLNGWVHADDGRVAVDVNRSAAVTIDTVNVTLYNGLLLVTGHVSDGARSTQGYPVEIWGSVSGTTMVGANGQFSFTRPFGQSYGEVFVQTNDEKGHFSEIEAVDFAN